MENTTLLDRPEADPAHWFSPSGLGGATPLRNLLLYRICDISTRMRAAALRDVLSAHDLDLRDWIVLARLSELTTGTQCEIAQTTKLDRVAVNRAAARLKERLLVTSRPHKRDRRSHWLELTEAGQETVALCAAALQAMERTMLQDLTAQEGHQLHQLLAQLTASVDALERLAPGTQADGSPAGCGQTPIYE